MVSFIDPAFILLNERYGLKIQDVGAGDVSPKFENKFFIVKYYREGVVPEYVLQTQTESLIRLASSGVRIPPYVIEQYEFSAICFMKLQRVTGIFLHIHRESHSID